VEGDRDRRCLHRARDHVSAPFAMQSTR
jgi:hypothetical protein